MYREITEQEAIKKHVSECRHRIGNIENFIRSNKDADINTCKNNIYVLQVAISALEENLEYREEVIYSPPGPSLRQ